MPIDIPYASYDHWMFKDLYPERRGDAVDIEAPYFWSKTRQQQVSNREKLTIEYLENNPYLKLIWESIERSGCNLNFSRHFSVEICEEGRGNEFAGTYDPNLNQVVICANNRQAHSFMVANLFKNMLEMFDNCTKKIEYNNVEHLACIEIRKANLGGCNFQAYLENIRKIGSFGLKNQQENCVKASAIEELEKVKFVPREKAEAAVEKVFDKCYKDLEPIGRRLQNKKEMDRAFAERYLFGY